jgi:hypothetical protein
VLGMCRTSSLIEVADWLLSEITFGSACFMSFLPWDWQDPL